MLYYLFHPLANEYGLFNVLKYITFRTAGAMLTAMILSFWIGPYFIKWLKCKQTHGQPIREEGPESHLLTKKGTPTMGGGLILSTIILSTLVWGNLANSYTWILLLVTTSFGLLGMTDDYIKLTKRHAKGMLSKTKFLAQVSISLVVCLWIMFEAKAPYDTGLTIPFFKDVLLNLGWFYIPFAIIVLVGASNAVNLTDGLDGLAIVPVMITAACFSIIAYLVGNQVFSTYLQIHFVPGAGEIAVFCGAIVGASLGFLWFNAPPAQVFMGDTGSLALGGALGTVAVITKHELVLFIIGGLFVMEAVSVMMQVAYFKWTKGKRIFLMTPIHHHFEKKGWQEATIVIRFWIISFILAIIGMTTLKLR